MFKQLILAVLCQALLSSLPAQSQDPDGRDQRWFVADFSDVDFSAFEDEIRARKPGQDASELSLLARRNLQYLFFNRLNRNRFLAPPSPQDVAERVSHLLRLNRQIADFILESRAALRPSSPALEVPEQRKLIRDIEDTTKRFRQQFGEFFVEPHESTYSFSVPQRKKDFEFQHFVLQADRINRHLTAKIDNYFLADSPGSIHLSEYRSVSITVLTESMLRLCRLSRQVLD